MSATYFWDGKEVLVYDYQVFMRAASKEKLHDLFCVDCFCLDTSQRYGQFIKDVGWQSLPLNNFPKEFRAHLLLLGVS